MGFYNKIADFFQHWKVIVLSPMAYTVQWRIYIVKFWTRPPPPRGSKFFQFHAFFGKIWQNRMLAPPPPGELAPPPRGNPGSATAVGTLYLSNNV